MEHASDNLPTHGEAQSRLMKRWKDAETGIFEGAFRSL
jgi:hypothetical protein